MVDRFESIKLVVESLREEDIVVASYIGATKFETGALRPLPSTLLLGMLGGTVALGMGIAIARRNRRVVVITTDGDLLMELGQLSPIVKYNMDNLKIIVLDNEYYESLLTPRPTLTGDGLDLAAIARASGIANSTTATTLKELSTALDNWLDKPESMCVVVKTNRGKSNAPIRHTDPIEDKFRFIRWIEETENINIIGGEQQDKILVKDNIGNS
ncbi:MAG: hypothetical protein GX973_01305 [Firmicutes bacterium]|nr:hypothetical protein [Bacillota bacterium]